MARSWNNWADKPFQVYGGDHIRLTRENTARVLEAVLVDSMENIRVLAKDRKNPGLVYIAAKAMIGAAERKEFGTVDKFLDRIIGKANQPIELVPLSAPGHNETISFRDFCSNAGYEPPYDRQIEMKSFGIDQPGAKLLLGARGYGKTDYVVILGVAYALYLDQLDAKRRGDYPEMSFLLVTKSDERNASILNEIAKAAAANGVPFEKQSGKALRVEGVKGKDHSVSAITIGSSSIRGRHPKKIIMDDPVTEEDQSEATRKQAERVYNELSKLTSDVLIIGQPVHKFDLYEKLRPLLNKLEVCHGEIPELDHDLEAQRLAGVSEESIQASYFLKVISEAGNPFEHVGFLDEYPQGGESSIAFVDPSFIGGDFTALTILKGHFAGVAVKGRVWKRAWYNCLDDMVQECLARGVKRLCFETNALGDQPVVMLRDLFKDDGIGVVGKCSTGHKHSRISAAGPFAKMIHIAKTSDPLYIAQIVKYEHGAKHDDAPDSLASALEWVGLIRGRIR